MKPKIIAIIIFFVLYTAGMIYIGFNINKPPVDNSDIIEDNIVIAISENSKELIDSLKIRITELNKKLLEKHNEINYQEPPKKDKHIPQVDEYIEFIPDFLPELPKIDETRIATIYYHYRDEPNSYSLDLRVKYIYSSMTFEFTPSKLNFTQIENRPFCFSAVLLSNGGGVHLSYDLFKRLRLGSGIYVDNEITPLVGISVGWVF